MGVFLMLFAVGCGDDDDGDPARGGAETTTDAKTATTQPTSSDEAAVQPYIEGLLAAWDQAMTSILGEPQTVADDPESSERADLAESFTQNSPYVDDLDELLAGYIEQDTGLRPGPSGRVQETQLLDFTEAPDDDHLSFVFCTFTDGVDYALSTGEERPSTVGIRQGAGTAVRVDGVWLLDNLQRLGFEAKPAGTPNPCPDLVAPEGG